MAVRREQKWPSSARVRQISANRMSISYLTVNTALPMLPVVIVDGTEDRVDLVVVVDCKAAEVVVAAADWAAFAVVVAWEAVPCLDSSCRIHS